MIVTSRRSARAQRHDEGRLGELHHLIADRGGAGSDLRASTQADLRRRVRDRLPAGELLRRAQGAWSPATAPPRSVLKHAQVSPAAHATSPIGSLLLAAALEGSLTLEEDMALLAAMAGHLRGSVDGVGGHERGERVRTTGVGSAGIGIVRALSAKTADVLRDLVEELAGAAG